LLAAVAAVPLVEQVLLTLEVVVRGAIALPLLERVQVAAVLLKLP
jgi:hypothetical protein